MCIRAHGLVFARYSQSRSPSRAWFHVCPPHPLRWLRWLHPSASCCSVLSSHTQVETECPLELLCPVSHYSTAHDMAAPAEVACEEAGTDTGVEGGSYCGSVLRPTDGPLGTLEADTMVTMPRMIICFICGLLSAGPGEFAGRFCGPRVDDCRRLRSNRLGGPQGISLCMICDVQERH